MALASALRAHGRVLLAAIFLALLSFPAWAELSFPALTGRVVDEAGILGPATQQQLNAMSAEAERRTGLQLVVATVKSLQGTAIEDYGYQLGRHWGIGQKGQNNGVILLVAPSERKVRIEVGYGLEDKLTDAQSRVIIESVILPAFRTGNFEGGIRDGTTAILRTLTGEAPVAIPQAQRQTQSSGFDPFFLLVIVFFVLIGGRGLFWPLLFMGAGRSFGGGFGGSYGGGGGFGGGGFSGGGGSFGGGGASGSW